MNPIKLLYNLDIAGVIFSLFHLLLAFFIYFNEPYDGMHGYVFMLIPDFPVAIVDLIFNYALKIEIGWFLYFSLGTAWWYVLGVWLKKWFFILF